MSGGQKPTLGIVPWKLSTLFFETGSLIVMRGSLIPEIHLFPLPIPNAGIASAGYQNGVFHCILQNHRR